MANLFTAVSAEQQEIVAGGVVDEISLTEDIVSKLTNGTFGFTSITQNNPEDGIITVQGFDAEKTTSLLEKLFEVEVED